MPSSRSLSASGTVVYPKCVVRAEEEPAAEEEGEVEAEEVDDDAEVVQSRRASGRNKEASGRIGLDPASPTPPAGS